MTLCTVRANTFVSGGLCRDWSVVYTEQRVCAVRNTTAVFRCSFTYPAGYTVKEVKWAHGESDNFFHGPFIFDSEINNSSTKFQYIGNKTSNCSLKIHQVEQTDAGHYAFRFITNIPTGKFTGLNGPELQVTGKFCLTSLRTIKSWELICTDFLSRFKSVAVEWRWDSEGRWLAESDLQKQLQWHQSFLLFHLV